MANQIYSNFVLGNKYESVLSTKLNLQSYMTIDNSLALEAGMKKKVVTRSVSGSVQDLAQGVGNSADVEVTNSVNEYDVGVTQGRFTYYDEEAMADPMVVDAGLTGLSEKMVNDFIAKAIAEYEKATYEQSYSSSVSFDTVVDAIGKLNLEDESGLFMLINPAMQAAFRKNVKDELKYSEGFVRTGYIGHICGVPVYISKAVPSGTAYIANSSAVTLFIKKESEIEQERDANTRKNQVFARKVALVALTDATKLVRIASTVTTAATVTTGTKATKTVGGAATTGAVVSVYINGVLDGTATAASSAYSYTAKENLVAGDKIIVVARKTGEVSSTSSEFTVAS